MANKKTKNNENNNTKTMSVNNNKNVKTKAKLSNKKNSVAKSKSTNKESEVVTKKQLNNVKFMHKIANKKIIFIILILVFVLILVLCLSNRKSSTAKIELKAYADGLYAWEYEIKDKSIVKFKEKTRTGDIEGKTHEGLIYETYEFQSLKSGKTTIKFTFVNTNNGSFLDMYEYNVTVDENLNLTIEKK